MPDQRQVYVNGHSLVVALSPAVREHLGVEPGQAVYWHLTRGGEAVLGKRPVRVGGPPEGIALQKLLDGERAKVERLRRKVAARPERAVGVGMSQGWSMAMRAEGGLGEVLTLMHRELQDIRAMLPPRRRAGPRAATPPRSSALPPSEPSSAGEAATPGAEPPGGP